jgi:hypothetical protein
MENTGLLRHPGHLGVHILAAQPRFGRGLDGPEPPGLPLADRAIINFL